MCGINAIKTETISSAIAAYLSLRVNFEGTLNFRPTCVGISTDAIFFLQANGEFAQHSWKI